MLSNYEQELLEMTRHPKEPTKALLIAIGIIATEFIRGSYENVKIIGRVVKAWCNVN